MSVYIQIHKHIQGMDVRDIARVVVYGVPDSMSQYYQVETIMLCNEVG